MRSVAARRVPSSDPRPAPPRLRGPAGGKRVLVVDPDRAASASVAACLGQEGYVVDVLPDGRAATASNPVGYDLVLLEVLLPARSGYDVLRAIRERLPVPVVLFTAADGETDRVLGYELGADDVVSKLVSGRELAARVRALFRRVELEAASGHRQASLQVDDVRLDPSARLAWRGGRVLQLTTAEFELLGALLTRAGQPVSRDELAETVLGRRCTAGGDRNVDNLVWKLRRKLGRAAPIRTIRNVGYLYAVSPARVAGTR